MSPSRLVRLLACTALFGLMSSCDILAPDGKDRLRLYVAPTMAECVGVGPQQCLLVKEEADTEWSNFYGSISGFTYESGYRYMLLVERRHIREPPADGSSYEYRLVRILARDAAPAG